MISRQFLLGAIGSTLIAFVLFSIAIFMWVRGEALQEVISQVFFSISLLGVSGLLFYKAYGTRDSDNSDIIVYGKIKVQSFATETCRVLH